MRQILHPSIFAVVFIAFHLYLLSQLSFTVWPEMLLMPYLMQRGFELYRDMILPWTPGLMWILGGWFSLVGLSADRLKLLTWILIAVIDVLLYRIAAKRSGSISGFLTLTFFLFLHPLYDGNGLWFDLAVVPLLLLAFHMQNLFFLGPAFLIKQSVIWLIPLIVFVKYQILYKIKYLILGVGSAIGISMVWFWSRGTLPDYWYWAYTYTFTIFPAMPGHADLATWRHWAFSLFPFLLMFLVRILKQRNLRWVIDTKDPLAWAMWSLPFAVPRFGLFHFQPAVAFLSIATGAFLTNPEFSHGENSAGTSEPRSRALATHGRRPWEQASVLLGLLFLYLSFSWFRLIFHSWHRPDRFLEPDVYQFAVRVALDTNPDEPVLLVNGPELAYILADRVPPKPWFTQFPWFLELPGFQERVIESFKQQGLRQVIFTPYLDEGKFVPGSYQPKKLLEYLSALSHPGGSEATDRIY